MQERRRQLQMCIVNPVLVQGLGRLVGSQADAMTCLGISWNTWMKIRSGRPILASVAQRLRARVLSDVGAVANFVNEFPSATVIGEADPVALEQLFVLPADSMVHAGWVRESRKPTDYPARDPIQPRA